MHVPYATVRHMPYIYAIDATSGAENTPNSQFQGRPPRARHQHPTAGSGVPRSQWIWLSGEIPLCPRTLSPYASALGVGSPSRAASTIARTLEVQPS